MPERETKQVSKLEAALAYHVAILLWHCNQINTPYRNNMSELPSGLR